jgi:hypothetical protein
MTDIGIVAEDRAQLSALSRLRFDPTAICPGSIFGAPFVTMGDSPWFSETTTWSLP